MTNDIRYGIIGTGMMGQEHIRNVALLEGARIGAVYDPHPDYAAQGATVAGGAEVAESLGDLLGRPDLDALIIASPNHVHVDQLGQIAAAGPARPVLCEKPLFTDPGQLDALDRFAASYGAPVWVAMEYRYMPPIAALLAEAEAATGGIKMLSIREHRFPFLEKIGGWNRFNASSGGTFVEKCCHFFDLMRLILKDEPVRIMASAGQEVNHKDESVDGAVPDIWDSGYVLVDFAGGTRAMLELCMFAEGSRYQEEVTAVGPKGKIEALVPGPGRFWPEDLGPAPEPQVILSPRAPKGPIVRSVPVPADLLEAGDHNGSTFYQHQKFLEVVRGRGQVEVSLTDGRRAVEMGLAAQEAARTGQVVRL